MTVWKSIEGFGLTEGGIRVSEDIERAARSGQGIVKARLDGASFVQLRACG